MKQFLNPAFITGLQQPLSPEQSALQRTLTANGIFESARSTALGVANTTVFSTEIETGTVTDQQSTGRCWLYASLNVLRHRIEATRKIEQFELSQTYNYFWDKLERANAFHENIVGTASSPMTDRLVELYFSRPQEDAGWWENSVALIEKYGVVPKNIMPEAAATANSADMNNLLNRKLRKDGLRLREMVQNSATEAEVDGARKQMLAEAYHFLTMTLGTPPQVFDFVYKDKDKKYHRDDGLTPLSFAKKYLPSDYSEYVSIIHSPAPDRPFNKTYSFKHLDTMLDGRRPVMLNQPVEILKSLALAQLKAGETVWFGAEILADSDRKAGFLTPDAYNFKNVYGIDFSLSKEQQLVSQESGVSHAMLLTGVDEVSGKAQQWKLENSWGDSYGHKGYFSMSDSWFDLNGYVVVIKRSLLSPELLAAADTPPIELEAWDLLGCGRPR